MQIADLKSRKLLLFECISGSKAYGLDTPSSDTDIKGVFLLPKEDFYSLDYIPQLSNESNDEVYYELGRFIELLTANNPNLLELLFTPDNMVLYKHSLMSEIKPHLFLSKLCKDSFGKYALSQIRKAKGLKKKIMNPMGKERKSVLDFCYVNFEQTSIPLLQFLKSKSWQQATCGLANIPHMKNVYGLYYSKDSDYGGIIKTSESNEVGLSSIPKDQQPKALLYFNKEGYSTYCKEYKEYWNWVEKRNEARYENTKSNGKYYDAKNMMHTFRLLEMAIEMGKYAEFKVQRPNREFLLDIKSGKYEYEELLLLAEKRKEEMEKVFEKSSLPDSPNRKDINELLFTLRKKLYK